MIQDVFTSIKQKETDKFFGQITDIMFFLERAKRASPKEVKT